MANDKRKGSKDVVKNVSGTVLDKLTQSMLCKSFCLCCVTKTVIEATFTNSLG